MTNREKRICTKKGFLAFLFGVILSSCQSGESSLLNNYEPSDDLKDEWQYIKTFNRWIDPRVGAFLLMEESCIDLSKFEAEENVSGFVGYPNYKTYRSKEFPDLLINTSSFSSVFFNLYNIDAPNRYVTHISWQNSELTFLGCRYSDGAASFGKACAKRGDELPTGNDLKPRLSRFYRFNQAGAECAEAYYRCMPMKDKAKWAAPDYDSLFELSGKWASLPDRQTGFVLDVYSSSLFGQSIGLRFS